MAQNFKEVAHLRGNDELYKQNYDRIFGNKNQKEADSNQDLVEPPISHYINGKVLYTREYVESLERTIDGYANVQNELLQTQKRLEQQLKDAREILDSVYYLYGKDTELHWWLKAKFYLAKYNVGGGE